MASTTTAIDLATELGNGAFSDARLNRRLALLTEAIGANPAASFPDIFNEAADLEAAYRFFGNPKVSPDRILSGHHAVLHQRMLAEPSLVLHDTTKFVFKEDGQRSGLGRIMKSGQAFFGHFALVVADDGTRSPLGVAGIQYWVRDDEPAAGRERSRWWTLANTISHRMHPAQMIHVMDCEADDYDLFRRMIDAKHRFVIRLKSDRNVVSDDGTTKKIRVTLEALESRVTRPAKLSKRRTANRNPRAVAKNPDRDARSVTLSIAAKCMTLKRPASQPSTSPPSLQVNVVHVWEAEPPVGEPPVDWVLYTTEPITTNADLEKIVDRYRARWAIEVFFKALKSGCAVESRQLRDLDALVNATTVFAPIAAMLLFLRSELDRAPEAAATTVLTDEHIRVLRTFSKRNVPQAPTVRDVVYALGGLGGHRRYCYEPPGWQTLTKGLAKLDLLVRGWNAQKLQRSYVEG